MMQVFEFEEPQYNKPHLSPMHKLILVISISINFILVVIGLVWFFSVDSNYEINCDTNDTFTLNILSRTEWNANDAKNDVTKLILPVEEFIIASSLTHECHTKEECSKVVKKIQDDNMMKANFSDIAYNFLVGGDGNVYEGRGWEIAGAHTSKFNSKSIGIAYIGNFKEKLPNENQIKAGFALFNEGVKLGHLKPDYKIFAQCQLRANKISPGIAFYALIQTWKGWSDVEKVNSHTNK